MRCDQLSLDRNKKIELLSVAGRQRGPTAMDSPASFPRENLFQRVWPPIVIGVIFVLEVIWIVFLVVYLPIALL